MFGTVSLLLYFCATVLCGVVPPTQDGEGEPLILTPYIKNGEIEKARNQSEVDPSLFAGVKSYAGYFTVNETAKWHLFSWFFPAPDFNPPDKTPLIIWLQGGPGGSSMFGLFEEIGPIQYVNNKIEGRVFGNWGYHYSLLFIDNPVGTGFSFTETEEYVTNEDQVGQCLLNHIQQFLEVYPELRTAPLFIAGESYAGKYIPAFGHYIHKSNADGGKHINLKGLLIGDGWTDPPTLLHYSELGEQLGFLEKEQAEEVNALEEQARKYWAAGNFDLYAKYAEEGQEKFTSYVPINLYNFISETIGIPDKYAEFLNREDVQKALHVKKMKFEPQSYNVYNNLMKDMYHTVKPWLEELLEHYGVMCYSGQLDIIVGYALSTNTYRSLEWSGAEEYRNAVRLPYYDNTNTFIGFVKESGNFMDVLVSGAGHMVPADQPINAHTFLLLFINKFQ
ncbi:unnamed protein product [Spodoptera littoralis]|uniref:Carboxypeptidase n=1 Tax=Spodoptera littoralis TaxID=7109 RepID=A0A9P0N164_SPOLI|nr:unnamed protein product [Spodoptera littoralis]CAH1637819.1 unnamed protein product [Spodoptera littoralis]